MLRYLFILLLPFSLLYSNIISFTEVAPAKTRLSAHNTENQISVKINPRALKRNQSISVNLPQNITVFFENSHFIYRKDGDFSWAGKPSNGSIQDSALFTTKDGYTYGVIFYNNNRYILKSNPDGSYNIFKESLKERSLENDSIQLPPNKPISHPLKSKSQESKTTHQNSAIQRASQRAVNDTVNVMILYTQAYADNYGNGLSANIQNSIDYGNVAMSNGGITLTYNLAYQQLYETAETNESVSMVDALARISGKYESGGYYYSDISINSDIRRLRADHDIDLTSLFRLNTVGGYVGLGWLPNSDTRPSIRSASYNVSEYSEETFAHESGHNFGCGHSRDVQPNGCSGALFDYACGYDTGTFGTIMSYNNNTIQYFSNPDLYPDATGGAVIGEALSDCSRVIEETKGTMAINNDISEINESGDTLNGYSVSGNISSQDDRDGYKIGLGGETVFTLSGGYYLNLYDDKGFLIQSFATSTTETLDNGIYNIIIGNDNDYGSDHYIGTGGYSLTMTSNYVEPPVNNTTIIPIINYLLF